MNGIESPPAQQPVTADVCDLLQANLSCARGALGTAGDRWGPLGIAGEKKTFPPRVGPQNPPPITAPHSKGEGWEGSSGDPGVVSLVTG